MKRGFIFSIDAALALIVVMGMAAVLLLYFQAVEPMEGANNSAIRVASDASAIGIRTDKGAIEFGLSNIIPEDKKFVSCSTVYKYEPRAGVIDEQYCKVVG